jgi:hypothetical protein
MLHYKPMDYEKASEILGSILDQKQLTAEEKEAVQTALGLLSLTVVSKKRLKSRLQKDRAQQDNNLNW